MAADLDTLLSLVNSYNPNANRALLCKAYEFGRQMHEGQVRRSGEPYLTHPVAVATYLAGQQLDDETLVTALLHDTIEDTSATFETISDEFGPSIAQLIDGVTKLTQLQLSPSGDNQAESFRKLFMAMSRDLRVTLVKLADRLHNMRTIRHMSAEKQAIKARETMEIYAPLAGRLGMQSMREELEDLSFQVLNPEGRHSIMRRYLKLRKETGDVIPKIRNDINIEMEKNGLVATIHGRAKTPYSIWRKMQTKELSFSRLSDIYGFRIILENEADCYKALGAIHMRWRAVPGRFKDYISQPKSNGYRSLHTTISGRNARRVEMQIRTRQMHDVAEAGVAATWSYKDGVKADNPFAMDPSKWLATLSERLLETGDAAEFLETVKLEMYADQVFCFTPKGDVISLPRGATPIDFAYAVHTKLGERTVSAKIDGIRQPLWTRLRNGQSVAIQTARGQTPQASWIDIANTGRAKAAIRKALRDKTRAGNIALGKELARQAFEAAGKKASEKALATAARNEGLSSVDEMLARFGAAELTARGVVQRLYPNLTRNFDNDIKPESAIVGLDKSQRFERAGCCQAIPGERIVGISQQGKGVEVHKIDCSSLARFEDHPELWIDLRWHEGQHPPRHTVTLYLTIRNDAGVLGRVCTLIGEQNANISNLSFLDRKPDYFHLMVDLELCDATHLHAVMNVLEADGGVAGIKRHRA